MHRRTPVIAALTLAALADSTWLLLRADLEGALRRAPPDRGSMFLFVKIADAHIP